jgi:endoglucanase
LAAPQIHYILGDFSGGVNPNTNQPYYSYVIGYGDNFPRAPHHRGASCDGNWCDCSSNPSPHILYGAMVGGPGENDDYSDTCSDYVQ